MKQEEIAIRMMERKDESLKEWTNVTRRLGGRKVCGMVYFYGMGSGGQV